MNREIKFRAWDKTNNVFFRNTNEAYKGNIEQLYIGLSGGLFIRDELGFTHESLFCGRCILQQYTGLKDKNGVEVYEGDIYNCGYRRSDGSHKYGDKNIVRDIRNFDPEDDFEVIGNIYEHSHLLDNTDTKIQI